VLEIEMKNWPAPAKLNLFLHITGQRDDGYHLLQTVFQLLDFGDQLQFRLRDDGQIIRRTDVPGVSADQDLVVRAARLLKQETGGNNGKGADIWIDKRLPMGGGLGGGSSDAATTLVALNQLWQTGLSTEQLCELGLQLGADVPVFVRGSSAWAEGVGEQLVPVELPKRWFVVLCPAINVSTAHVFGNSQLRRDCPPITIRDFLQQPEACTNVCEPLVSQQYPEVAEALALLGQFGPARMTGTGASCFVAFESEQSARQAWSEIRPQWREAGQGFVAGGVNRSPLYG
jgi:4-diphosphocytidyl-2-C-methyl-D-erythritol kinase